MNTIDQETAEKIMSIQGDIIKKYFEEVLIEDVQIFYDVSYLNMYVALRYKDIVVSLEPEIRNSLSYINVVAGEVFLCDFLMRLLFGLQRRWEIETDGAKLNTDLLLKEEKRKYVLDLWWDNVTNFTQR